MRIFAYSKVADWDDRLVSLERLAEKEPWGYASVPDKSPLPVLDGYVRYTFLRLSEQSRVAEIDDLACFNTGLLTPAQEEIFGVFRVSDQYDPGQPIGPANKKWFLTRWACSGDHILTAFESLPEMATYWTDPAELIFDPNLEVRPRTDHIIRENLNRFPVELGGQVDDNGVPLDLTEIPDVEAEEEEGEAATGESESEVPAAVFVRARNALEGAIGHSVRLARRSYRVAVPQFYRDNIQLLLPLYLRDAGRPDLALTLERPGNWYRAATVLYPDWAYRHARLLSRPNSEWLGGFLEEEGGRRGP